MRWAHESSDEDLLPVGPPVSGGGQLSARVNEARLARSAESDRPRAAPVEAASANSIRLRVM
uniref:Uncharacterized protein n=1 Tax=Oryza sativa subsp. japonica TaxID=39947 RepID=Q69RL3_ORYSJ|nr:hypothetical protein [Oryza sativa Japonica Group]